MHFYIFITSRRRHTIFDCDWSSDVCSSDLGKRVHLVDDNFDATVIGIVGDVKQLSARDENRPYIYFPIPQNDRQIFGRSEEHTSELQSQSNLVCRLLLEKTKKLANSSPGVD